MKTDGSLELIRSPHEGENFSGADSPAVSRRTTLVWLDVPARRSLWFQIPIRFGSVYVGDEAVLKFNAR